MRGREQLSVQEARRVALRAQGFADPRHARGRGLQRVLARTGLLQIDSVNVLERAHYLPPFSRLGAYDAAALDRMSHRAPRRLFEYWGHEASLLPVSLWPLLQWRMARAHRDAWGGIRRIADERPELVGRMLEVVRERGPVAASEVAEKVPRRRREMWAWSEAKRALEWLFWSGRVTSARRLPSFERAYDLPERVLPTAVLEAPVPSPEEAQRELLRIAGRSLGVATTRHLRDYFRLPAADARARVAELVEERELQPVRVDGEGGWYLHREAVAPRRVEARALLAPFDPLIWERARVERLFGFRYRIEIYVPAPRRVHGYYVLPFLLGDRLVARVDLKADRRNRALLVRREHHERDAPAETREALREELALMASWLGLDRVMRG